MLQTVILHGALAEQFGVSFDLDVKSPVEAVRALIVQLKGFRSAIRNGHFRLVRVGKRVADSLSLEETNLGFGKAHELHIVPVIAGSASGWGKILAGVAIVGLAIAAPYALGFTGGITGALGTTFGGISAIGFSGITFGQVAGFGALIAAGGIAQALSPAPTLSGGSAAQDSRESFLFGSADNVTAQGGPVPVVFGEFVTGSVVVSAGLSTEEIGSSDALDTGVIIRSWFTSKLGG